MLKKVAMLLAIGITLLVITGLFLSPEYNVEQSILIKTRPENIHSYVNDLKQWPRWTPWQEMDPGIKIRYGNVTKGIGASQSWQGKGGRGHLHITASSPYNGIAYDVFFGEADTPSISAIEYKELDIDSTRVTWRLHGEIDLPVLGGYIAILVRAMTRDMYKKGLYKLKTVVENDNKPDGFL